VTFDLEGSVLLCAYMVKIRRMKETSVLLDLVYGYSTKGAKKFTAKNVLFHQKEVFVFVKSLS